MQARDQAAGPSTAEASSSGANTESIRAAIAQVTKGLVERDAEARLMLLAALAGVIPVTTMRPL